jgi:hypothetical protein
LSIRFRPETNKQLKDFYPLFLGAFFAAAPQKTGLSTPIFFAATRQKSISASIPCAFRKEPLYRGFCVFFHWKKTQKPTSATGS